MSETVLNLQKENNISKESIFKIFFSKIKEQKWLNDMGAKGYRLASLNDSKYTFELSDSNTYTYSIENLGISPKSEDGKQLISQKTLNGVEVVHVHKNWVYFCTTDSDIIADDDVYKKNRSIYFWRSVYLFFFSMFGAIVCGYQAFASKFLVNIQHTSDGMLEMLEKGTGFKQYLNIGINRIFNLLNGTYLKFFREIFGNSDASVIIAFILPIVFILLVCFTFNFDEYLGYLQLSKKTTLEIIPEDNHAE